MKAIMKLKPEKGLTIKEVEVPSIQENEVLIKIIKTSLCGTDLHIYLFDEWAKKTIKPPIIIGHEFMGEIVKVGSFVKDLKIGDRVSAEGHVTCGKCPLCLSGQKHLCIHTVGLGVNRDGCFAEYLSVPAENVFILPKFVPDNLAAIFDPFGNAVHTALSFPLIGEDVLITGAGPIGIMAAAIAQKAGARSVTITDRMPYRLELAKQIGATNAVDITKESLNDIRDRANIPFGFTVGLEMSGNPKALNDMLLNMRPGGNVALLGILPPNTVIDFDLVIFKMLNIKGIYGREIFNTWFQMIHLLESGLDISSIITNHFPYSEFEKGFALMEAGKSGKIILDWTE